MADALRNATQTKPVAVAVNPMAAASMDLSKRVYDLSALLSCVAHQLEFVHDCMECGDSEASDKLWQGLRAVKHCEALAGQIATAVEGAPYV